VSDHQPAALDGIHLLDLTEGVSGPYCTKLLADLGADVVKVERPRTGDVAREAPPFAGGEPGPERSLLFHYLNTNKRSVILDLEAVGAGAELDGLLSWADVVVESFPPGTMERLGLGYQELSRVNPRLVLTSVSSFGQTGPYRDLAASELVLSAMGGMMALRGSTAREPIKHGLMQAHYSAGATAAYATIAAVLRQEQSGAGCWIDVSAHEVIASELVLTEPLYAWAGGVQGRRPDSGDSLNNIAACQDGYVVVQVTKEPMWTALVEMFKSEELADEKFATSALRVANGAELDRLLRDELARRTKREIFDLAMRHRVLAGAVQDPQDLLDCPQLNGRGYFTEVTHPVTGTLRYPGAPVRLHGTPWALRRRAPLLGEHTTQVRAEVTAARGLRPAPVPGGSAPSARPLAGLRVLDLSAVFAMPYLAGMLADLGAEVIKVEAPHRLELARDSPTFTVLPDNYGGERPWDQSGTFANVNRGKRSCTLNLTTEPGRDLFRRLVAISDVVVESYTPRVLRSWGLTYPELRSRWAVVRAARAGHVA
jgi:crotonobetainyl-CoA:carnitine CoA-transferase CaiB-like acyl-CoA transferase